ncbi:hypothetical protein [Myceligenerans halotolerans]
MRASTGLKCAQLVLSNGADVRTWNEVGHHAEMQAATLGDATSPAAFFRDRAGVAATDGALCGEAGQGFLRLNLATPRPILREALTRMGTAVAHG